MTTTINFNDLAAGTIVDNEFAADGVTVKAFGGSGQAMIFDTANPTGGDEDLRTSNLGKALIISEDGDTRDPDDNAQGGKLRFEFDQPATVQSLTFLDVEEGAWVKFYDAQGNFIKQVDVQTANNGQCVVEFDVDGVARMDVILGGSGAIDNLVFDAPLSQAEPDGVVDGEEFGEVMELGYDDSNAPTDQGGDMITNGDDVIFGNGGDDTIDGAAGDDTIFGDSGSGGAVLGRESFNWEDVSEGEVDSSVTQDTGSVQVTYTRLVDTGAHQSELSDDDLNVDGIDTGGETIDDDTGLRSVTNGQGNDGDFEWVFSDPVGNVEFNINDIDGDGVVTVTAFDADGNEIPVQLVGGDELTVTGNVADSDGGYDDTDSDDYNLQVTIPGPVSRIVVEHDQDGGNNSGIVVTDIYFDVLDPDTDGEGGDDVISGGAGADAMFGEGGDDTFIIDDVADADGDNVVGGNGPDDTADNDVLDLRGTGQVTIDAVDDGTDSGAQSGTVTFEDGSVLTFSQIETILTDPQNEAPTANDDDITVDEDDSVTFDPTANDVDPDGDPLEVDSFTQPDNGTVTQNPDGTLTYTPDPNYNGPDSFEVTVTDPSGETSTSTVNVTVDPVNDAPDAVNDVAETDEETPVTIDVLANDTDVDGDDLTITAASVPTEQGTVDIVNNELVFTPAEDFFGEATISYSIEDGNGGTDVAEVTVTVNNINDDPVAVDDIAETDEDTPVTIDVLANDEDADGDPLTIIDATVPPEQGTVDIVNNELVFTPAENFNGPATITYTVDDGNGGTDEGEALVNVGAVNDGPTANDDSEITDEDTPVTIDVLGNDEDPDGDDLTITAASVPADQGTVDIVNNQLVYTPAPNFNGDVTIEYSITDGNGGTDSAEVAVTVNPVNDDPVAVDDIETTDEDVPVIVDLLGNDSDIDGDDLTIQSLDVDPAEGSVVDNGDGTVTFTPAPNFNGPATITYVVSDGNGGTDEGEAVISVGAVNDSPIAEDDVAETDEDTPVTISVLDNDEDPDGDPLSVVSATVPADQGTVEIVDDELVFTPAPDFNGDATITYTITDGNGLNDTADVVVTVNPVGDAPVAEDDTAETDEDTPVTIDVLDNDEDPDGDPLTVTEATSPDGTVDITPDGTITFTPDENFNGPTTITSTVQDPDGNEDTATVDVNVIPVNDAPEAVDDADTTPFNTPVTVAVLTNDFDVDGDDINVVAATSPDGTVDINPDGTITFTPNDGFEGVATVDYTIEDEEGLQDAAQVLITVEDDPRDGIVSGTDDGELIDENYDGDPEGDFVDNADNIFDPNNPLTEDDDIIEAGGGDDTILAGDGADLVNAGEGDDEVHGGPGNDTINGEDGEDTIAGGAGDDVVDGGADDDDIRTGDGSDTVEGGTGDDVIDTSDDNFAPDKGFPNDDGTPIPGFPFGFAADDDPEDDRDSVDGGDGDDTISTGDDADTIVGGDGSDVIDGGIDDDIIDGDDTTNPTEGGDDRIVGGEGNDLITGGVGDDTIYAGNDPDLGLDQLNIEDDGSNPLFPADPRPDNGMDTVFGGDGNDVIFGADDDDELFGEEGNDTIDGEIDDDLIDGGAGDDSLIGGQGDDTLEGGTGNDTLDGGIGDDEINGGADRDLIVNVNAGDTVDGGGEGDDFDVLDLRGSTDPNGSLQVTFTNPDSNGNGFDGFVTYFDENGDEVGTLEFTEIEDVIPCFTPGTLIATPTGERRVEDLKVGDRVITRDNGIQEIRWVGQREMTGAELEAAPNFKPVLIREGALGKGLPERDMLVSPQHRVLMSGDKTELYFDESEVLVAAKHLTGMDGIDVVDVSATTYIHVMFDQHEVILSDGTWTESFQPGDMTLGAMGDAQRAEIIALFPELETADGVEAYTAARRSLKKHEARLLIQ